MSASALIYFDDFQFDPTSGELCRDGECVPLLPKDSGVLGCLLTRPDAIVSKKDLLTEVWQGTVVSDGVIKTCIKRLRQQLGDNSKNPNFIETVHRRGYRFIGKIRTDAQEPAFAAPSEQGPDIVGRESELSDLMAAYRLSEEGKSQYRFVTGEAGIGKSALVHRFEAQLREQSQPLIARGNCVNTLGSGEAYAPLFGAFEMMARQMGMQRFGDLMRRFAPMWLLHMPWLLAPGEAEAMSRQLIGVTAQRMLRELVMLFDAIAGETTIVLILEDLHWADGATLDALMVLINQLVSCKIIVVATSRPEGEVHARLRKVRLESLRHDHCEQIDLLPLTEEDIDFYLSTRFAGKARPMMLAGWLMRYTEGNPLFLKALLAHAREQGWLRVGAQVTWEAPKSKGITWSVPNSLREFIRDRFDGMPARFRDHLQIASVTGLRFQTRLLCGEPATEEIAVDELLAALVEQYHFIIPDGAVTWPDGTRSPCYAFAHAWYRQVVYDQLSVLRKRELHRLIGERLEAIFGDLRYRIAAELAIHFEMAQDLGKAITYRRMAGEAAFQRHAYQEVRGHMEKGLEMVAQVPDENQRTQQEIPFRVLLGTTLSITSGYSAPDVADNYSRARALCRLAEGRNYLLPVLYGLWGYYLVCSEFEEAAGLIQRFEQAAERDGTMLDRVYARFMACFTDYYSGRFISAIDNAESCLAAIEPGDVNEILQLYGLDPWTGSLTHRGMASACLGYPRRALADVDRSEAIAKTMGLPMPLVAALAIMIGTHILVRDLETAAGHVARLVRLTEKHGIEYWKFHGAIFTGYFEMVNGDPDIGAQQINQVLDTLAQAGALITQTYYYYLLADACQRIGDFESGLAFLDGVQNEIQTNPARWITAELYRQKGDFLLARYQADRHVAVALESAEENYMTALDIAGRQKARLFELRAATGLCRLRMQQGRPGDGRRRLQEVYNWFDEGFEMPDLKAAESLLGQLS